MNPNLLKPRRIDQPSLLRTLNLHAKFILTDDYNDPIIRKSTLKPAGYKQNGRRFIQLNNTVFSYWEVLEILKENK